MGSNAIETKGIVWHHISQVNEADLEGLQQTFKFHHLDYDDIRAETPISKMDPYKHYVFNVFHIPVTDHAKDHVYGEEVYIFISKDALVTATHVSIPALDDLFEKMKSNAKLRTSILGKGTAFCMHKILADLFRDSIHIVGNLTQEVHRLEDAIERSHDKRLTVDLAHARRNILYLRHVIDPQRSMLTSLSNLKRPFLPEDVHVYLDDVHDILDTVWLSADNLKLIVDGLFDMNEALLSHKTNEIITILTVVSVSFMFPMLLAGFYGMNVSWLPWHESPLVVLALYSIGFFGMLAFVVAVIRRPRS